MMSSMPMTATTPSSKSKSSDEAPVIGLSPERGSLGATAMTPILNLPADLPSFDRRFAVIDSILPDAQWQPVRTAIDTLVDAERSYLPTHKKGGTVSYETLRAKAPAIVALYRSQAFRELISQITGVAVAPTPLHDQSSCSILFYEKPGDHIGWHYDHNFYKGRHFTVLVPVINRDSKGDGLSAARLNAKLGGAGCRGLDATQSPDRIRRRPRPTQGNAHRRGRAPRRLEHDLLRGSAEFRLAGHRPQGQGHGLFRA